MMMCVTVLLMLLQHYVNGFMHNALGGCITIKAQYVVGASLRQISQSIKLRHHTPTKVYC